MGSVVLLVAIALALRLVYNRGNPGGAADQPSQHFGVPTGQTRAGSRDRSSTDQQLQHFDGALDYSKRSRDPVQSDLYARAGRSLEAGDARTAEALYREAIARYPRDPDGYLSLGACLYFSARYDEAKAEYLHALDLDGQSAVARYGLGCVACEQQLYDEAKEHLGKALALDGNRGDFHLVLAMVYDKTGDRREALIHYERALSLDPSLVNWGTTKQRLEQLRR